MDSIPKVIHYCWFGGNRLSRLNKKCIASWRKYLPDYEIIEWNEKNFDVNIIPYTQQAYQMRRWAFVSDYARFWIIYHYGGIYLDTDVELIRPIDDIIAKGNFMGCETYPKNDVPFFVNPGLGFGCSKGNYIIGELLKIYSNLNFLQDGRQNLQSIVYYTSEYLLKCGAKKVSEIQEVKDIVIYPKDYFNPWSSSLKKVVLTDNTRSIHHFAGSWFTKKERIMNYVERVFGERGVSIVHRLYGMLKQLNKNT